MDTKTIEKHKPGREGKFARGIVLDPTLTLRSRVIYALLTCYANDKRECSPNTKDLLRSLRISPGTFYKHLGILIDRGIVKKERIMEGNLARGTLYTLCDFGKNGD